MISVDWNSILTSTVVSAFISGIVGTIIKSRFDIKLETNKQEFERKKVEELSVTQREIEILKSEIAELNALKQKNLEYYHTISQASHDKRIKSIECIWGVYLDLRVFISPIIEFYAVFNPDEYIDALRNRDIRNDLNLETLSSRVISRGMDTIPTLYKLEEHRPFLGEIIYYKFRSSLCVLLRLKVMFDRMDEKKEIFRWQTDPMLNNHLEVIYSSNTITFQERDIEYLDKENSRNLNLVLSGVENELIKTIEKVLSGEQSANLSLERANKINEQYAKGFDLEQSSSQDLIKR